jgi:lipid-A-disaccharide synthase
MDGIHYPDPGPLELRRDGSAEILAAADAAIVKSGTATLEAALAGVPMVVAYRVHSMTAWLARRMIKIPWVSLVNLIANRAVVPELLQERATAEQLAEAAAPLLEANSPAARAQREGFQEVRQRLGGPGAARRVAEIALELLPGR